MPLTWTQWPFSEKFFSRKSYVFASLVEASVAAVWPLPPKCTLSQWLSSFSQEDLPYSSRFPHFCGFSRGSFLNERMTERAHCSLFFSTTASLLRRCLLCGHVFFRASMILTDCVRHTKHRRDTPFHKPTWKAESKSLSGCAAVDLTTSKTSCKRSFSSWKRS